jgi:hypothetical protein
MTKRMAIDPESVISAVKVVGSAALAVGPTAKVIAERVFEPALDAIGQHWGDKVKEYFANNLSTGVGTAARMIEDSGRDPQPIPMRTAVPLLEGCSREDNPSLQQMWAGLIATAGTSDAEAVPPLFAHMLSQLTPAAAQYLRAIPMVIRRDEHNESSERGPHFGADAGAVMSFVMGERDFGLGDAFRLALILDVLTREALIEREADFVDVGDGVKLLNPGGGIQVTAFGHTFLRACEYAAGRDYDGRVPGNPITWEIREDGAHMDRLPFYGEPLPEILSSDTTTNASRCGGLVGNCYGCSRDHTRLATAPPGK